LFVSPHLIVFVSNSSRCCLKSSLNSCGKFNCGKSDSESSRDSIFVSYDPPFENGLKSYLTVLKLSEKDIPVCNKLNLSLNFSICKYTFLTEKDNNVTKKQSIYIG
jgi:hypothetical protein